MKTERNSAWGRFINKPMVWGGLLSVGFYTLVHQPSFHGGLLHKYTTEHVTEYVIVVLFFWAVADLALRYLGFAREWLALNREWLPRFDKLEPATAAHDLVAHLDNVSSSLRDSKIGRRLRRTLNYVCQRESADGFREYLYGLAEEDANETHSNYSFARFVGAITPVLGLLGTVVHFGVALGGLSMDGLMEKLPDMVTHMGTAFNTTCVALSASMTTLFFLFMVERIEERIVRDVNMRVENELLNRFEQRSASITPFLDAVQTAQQATLLAMQQFQKKHLETWSATLAHEQERWETNDRNRESQLRQLLTAVERRQTSHDVQVQAVADRVTQLNQSTTKLAEMMVGDGRLLDLQGKLAQNLELLHRSQQFDQAMHGLTAAIHLLTARQPMSPPGKAA